MAIFGFVLTAAVQLLDPLALGGYIASSFIRRLWLALLGSFLWAAAMAQLSASLGGVASLPSRILGALVFTATAFAVINAVRSSNAAAKADESAQTKVRKLNWQVLLVLSFAAIPIGQAIYALSEPSPGPRSEHPKTLTPPQTPSSSATPKQLPSSAMQYHDTPRMTGIFSICDYVPRVSKWKYFWMGNDEQRIYRSCHGEP